LIDFLNKYSTPIFVVIILAAGGLWAKRWWDSRQLSRLNAAFSDLELARAGGNPSPESLRSVADTHEGVAGVSLVARLETADIYLNAARSGLAPGAQLDPITGDPVAPEDALTDETRASYRAQAAELFRQVEADARTAKRPLLEISAAFGRLAADGATPEGYQRLAALCRQHGQELLAKLAEQRGAALPAIGTPEPPIAAADLPPLPGADIEIPDLDSIGTETGDVLPALTDPIDLDTPAVPDPVPPSDPAPADPAPADPAPAAPAAP
jgi:hypothetical protein